MSNIKILNINNINHKNPKKSLFTLNYSWKGLLWAWLPQHTSVFWGLWEDNLIPNFGIENNPNMREELIVLENIDFLDVPVKQKISSNKLSLTSLFLYTRT